MESSNINEKVSDVELERVTSSELPLIVSWFNDQELGKFMDDDKPNQVYTTENLQYLLNQEYGFYFTVKYKGNPIGFTQIYDIANQSGEFSFLLDKSEQGKGLGKKIVSKLCEKAKENNLGKLVCSIYKQNISSIKSVEKNDFIRINQTEKEFLYEKHID